MNFAIEICRHSKRNVDIRSLTVFISCQGAADELDAMQTAGFGSVARECAVVEWLQDDGHCLSAAANL